MIVSGCFGQGVRTSIFAGDTEQSSLCRSRSFLPFSPRYRGVSVVNNNLASNGFDKSRSSARKFKALATFRCKRRYDLILLLLPWKNSPVSRKTQMYLNSKCTYLAVLRRDLRLIVAVRDISLGENRVAAQTRPFGISIRRIRVAS